jgi:hypothetical protein
VCDSEFCEKEIIFPVNERQEEGRKEELKEERGCLKILSFFSSLSLS